MRKNFVIFSSITLQTPEFSLITTDDNDGKKDCKHSPINMKVDVTYYIP